jgi:hypothetical protein
MPDAPGPWKLWRQFGDRDDVGGVEDANGKTVFTANDVGEVSFSSSESERLVLAAPELLEALKATAANAERDEMIVHASRSQFDSRPYAPSQELQAARNLIDRIEKGPNA